MYIALEIGVYIVFGLKLCECRNHDRMAFAPREFDTNKQL